MKKEIKIQYEHFPEADIKVGFDGPLKKYQAAVETAIEGRERSYSPYSQFQVGAGIELEDGTLFHGSNQEVSAFPSCICAERVALAKAQDLHSTSPIKYVAVTAKLASSIHDVVASPCGSCRQALLEAQSRQTQVFKLLIYASDDGLYVLESVRDLLPFGFSGDILER